MERNTAWEIWDDSIKKEALDFCEGYKEFLSDNKTERRFVKGCLNIASEFNVRHLNDYKKLKPGDMFYKTNKEKVLLMGRIGEKPLIDGCRFIVSHIDSPRLDLKTNPLYEDENICLLKTYYYGGIK
ncbi:MAG: aminopeptidase, partial [Candidatus Omnitrophica bacterium]|nr:aminopeptidase [Candidatus Omnitrophota bacterium]